MATIADIAADTLTEYFEFLDDLRVSGETNMFGAGSYLADVFGLDSRECRAVLSAWMNTFAADKSAEDRAIAAQVPA